MNADSARLTTNISSLTARGTLNVVLACQDYSAGMHALCLFDRLFSSRDEKFLSGTQSIWKFDMMGIATLREIAAQEAAAADLVILSTHAPEELPDTVKTWINTWIERRNRRPGAMVLLLDDTGGEAFNSFPVETFVQECATRADMTFSLHKTDGRHMFDDFEMATDPGKRARTFATFRENLFAEAVEQFRDWSAGGVNRGFDV